MSTEHALTLLRIALELAPALARIIRAGVDASPGDETAERVASILPARSESETAAEELRRDTLRSAAP